MLHLAVITLPTPERNTAKISVPSASAEGTVLLGMGFCFWMFAQRHLSGSSWKKTVETRTDLHCTRHRRVTQGKISLPSSLGTVRISRYCIRVGIGSWWIGDITFVIRDEGWCRTKSVLNKTELLASQKGCLWRNKAGLFLLDWPPSIQHTQFCVCIYIYNVPKVKMYNTYKIQYVFVFVSFSLCRTW